MLTDELRIAKGLAREAGRIILAHYERGFAVEYKRGDKGDPVTAADKEANELIVRGLARAFPDDAILAEESPRSVARHERRRLWCVDPLDGTQELIARNGQFVVMIGLAVDGDARAGVVYQPTTDVLWWGAGDEAFREEHRRLTPLTPSRQGDPRAAVMMVSRSHRSSSVSRVAEALGVVREEPLGSVGLKVTRLAEGAADIYLSVSTSTHEWDACAPEAILRAAGGLMTDTRGEPLRYNKPETNTPFGLLATNGPLHAACVEAVRPVIRERGWV